MSAKQFKSFLNLSQESMGHLKTSTQSKNTISLKLWALLSNLLSISVLKNHNCTFYSSSIVLFFEIPNIHFL